MTVKRLMMGLEKSLTVKHQYLDLLLRRLHRLGLVGFLIRARPGWGLCTAAVAHRRETSRQERMSRWVGDAGKGKAEKSSPWRLWHMELTFFAVVMLTLMRYSG